MDRRESLQNLLTIGRHQLTECHTRSRQLDALKGILFMRRDVACETLQKQVTKLSTRLTDSRYQRLAEIEELCQTREATLNDEKKSVLSKMSTLAQICSQASEYLQFGNEERCSTEECEQVLSELQTTLDAERKDFVQFEEKYVSLYYEPLLHNNSLQVNSIGVLRTSTLDPQKVEIERFKDKTRELNLFDLTELSLYVDTKEPSLCEGDLELFQIKITDCNNVSGPIKVQICPSERTKVQVTFPPILMETYQLSVKLYKVHVVHSPYKFKVNSGLQKSPRHNNDTSVDSGHSTKSSPSSCGSLCGEVKLSKDNISEAIESAGNCLQDSLIGEFKLESDKILRSRQNCEHNAHMDNDVVEDTDTVTRHGKGKDSSLELDLRMESVSLSGHAQDSNSPQISVKSSESTYAGSPPMPRAPTCLTWNNPSRTRQYALSFNRTQEFMKSHGNGVSTQQQTNSSDNTKKNLNGIDKKAPGAYPWENSCSRGSDVSLDDGCGRRNSPRSRYQNGCSNGANRSPRENMYFNKKTAMTERYHNESSNNGSRSNGFNGNPRHHYSRENYQPKQSYDSRPPFRRSSSVDDNGKSNLSSKYQQQGNNNNSGQSEPTDGQREFGEETGKVKLRMGFPLAGVTVKPS